MNKGLAAFLGFLLGGATGGIAGWLITKRIDEKNRDAEIQSILDAFEESLESEERKTEPEVTPAEKNTYEEIVTINNYVPEPDSEPVKIRYADKGTAKPKARAEKMFKPPYIIEDYEFDEDNDYRKITLTYYADGKLVDEIGTNVEAEAILGDALKSFGNGDALYVRNERLRCDYEVLKDDAKYSDVVAKKPYIADDDDDAESE